MFGTVSTFGVEVARQRAADLHRDADRYRLARSATHRPQGRRVALRARLRLAFAR